MFIITIIFYKYSRPISNFFISEMLLIKVRAMQNLVTSCQIDRHGYHSIGNSRFSGIELASENAHAKRNGGLKFWGSDLLKLK